MSSLTENIALIRAHTEAHEELKLAHHFLYDLRSPTDGAPQYVVMGINPGETAYDWEFAPVPTEETSQHDFHVDAGPSQSAIKWAEAAGCILENADYVLTELFFWSSANAGNAFTRRFGPIRRSKHLPFCKEMNRQLIEAYQPRAVVFSGITYAYLARDLYDLKPVSAVRSGRERLIEHLTDGTRPWIFTKHWTGSRGFSNEQRDTIRDYIRTYS